MMDTKPSTKDVWVRAFPTMSCTRVGVREGGTLVSVCVGCPPRSVGVSVYVGLGTVGVKLGVRVAVCVGGRVTVDGGVGAAG
jgi:hypothetical protein